MNGCEWVCIIKLTLESAYQIVYLDNIFIFTWILKDYYKVVYKVFKVLAKYKLFLCYKNISLTSSRLST